MIIYGAEHPNPRTRSIPLLAYALERHWSIPSPFELDRGPYGKPFLPAYPDCHFNISHSGTYILCALDDAPIGIDIQIVKPRRTAFLDRICSPEERKWLSERSDNQNAFTQFWCIKESACKQTGRGLTFPVSEIQIPLPHNDERHLNANGVWYSLFHGTDWYACVCGKQPWDGEIIWHNAFNI